MRKKIFFIIPSLAGGGAEKVLVDLLCHLDRDKYQMHLVLFEKKGVHLGSIPSHVSIYDLKKKNRYSFFKLIFSLVSLFRALKPDTVLSFMAYTNIVTVLASFLFRIKFNLVISIHTNLTKSLLSSRCSRVKKFLYVKLFNYADYTVVPSLGIKEHLLGDFGLNEQKIRVINNPLDLININRLGNEGLKNEELGKYIVAVGRLERPKDYPTLLKAYALISAKVEEKLVILGEGEEKERLKQIAKDLKIQKKVLFLGFKNNPYKFMKTASIFVLSSIWESFAIVLTEAMACGTPVVSTDCSSGPDEIITNGKNGLLVLPSDEKALAEAMVTLLRDKDLRKKFSEEGRKRAEDFKIEKILPQYEEVF